MKTFSIITVCKNSEKTIERTIQSVLSQTYNDYEYIIIDGKSTDSTLKIVNSYAKKFNRKLKIISEKDNGIYDAMNKGISIATGEYIGIINSDDYYEVDALMNVKKEIDKSLKYQVIYGLCRVLNSRNIEEGVFFSNKNIIDKRPLFHPSTFIKKSVYIDFGLYNCAYKYASDYDYLVKISLTNSVVFSPVYKILSNFTLGGASEKIESSIETFKIRKKYSFISNTQYIFNISKEYISSLFNNK